MPSATAQRYRQLIRSLVSSETSFEPTRESATAVQVERCAVLADALARRPFVPLPGSRRDVVDAAGHRRSVYRPLLVYAHRLAGGDVTSWLASLSTSDAPFTAAAGDAAAAAVWSALAVHVWTDERRPAEAVFSRLVDGQQPNGSLLRATASDNPETHWFHELVVLHALADHALRSGDANAMAAVDRAAEFHLNETEPDHATGQPWGLPAFVRRAETAPLADALLHAVSAHQPRGPTGVALFLLADTLYGLGDRPLEKQS